MRRYWPLLATVLLLASTVQATLMALAHWHYSLANNEIAVWGLAAYEPTATDMDLAQRELALASARWSQSPDLLSLQASLSQWRARAAEGSARRQLLRQSIDFEWRAQLQRPTHRQGWQRLAFYKEQAGEFDAKWLLALKRLDTYPQRSDDND